MQNEEALKMLQLDSPSSVKFAHALLKYGIKVKDSTDIEGMVEHLCQLRLKK